MQVNVVQAGVAFRAPAPRLMDLKCQASSFCLSPPRSRSWISRPVPRTRSKTLRNPRRHYFGAASGDSSVRSDGSIPRSPASTPIRARQPPRSVEPAHTRYHLAGGPLMRVFGLAALVAALHVPLASATIFITNPTAATTITSGKIVSMTWQADPVRILIAPLPVLARVDAPSLILASRHSGLNCSQGGCVRCCHRRPLHRLEHAADPPPGARERDGPGQDAQARDRGQPGRRSGLVLLVSPSIVVSTPGPGPGMKCSCPGGELHTLPRGGPLACGRPCSRPPLEVGQRNSFAGYPTRLGDSYIGR